MKVVVTSKGGEIALLGIETQMGLFGIAQRDDGIEVMLNGKAVGVFARGHATLIEEDVPPTPAEPDLVQSTPQAEVRCGNDQCGWEGGRTKVRYVSTGNSTPGIRTICPKCHGARLIFAIAAPQRPSWPETWMAIAQVIAARSYDPRLKVGAIVVTADNTQMLSGGYNGNYAGGPHEHESSEPGQSGFIHAETNALLKLDFNHPKEKHMYLTHSPCRMCAKLIVNAGIRRVVYAVAYRDPSGVELLLDAGVEALHVDWAVKQAREKAEYAEALAGMTTR